MSVSIYYGTQSDIRVKIYCRFNLLRASVLNFESLDILWDTIGYLLSFEFAQSFCFQFRASRHITGFNRIMELKVVVGCICYELLFSITSNSIYYGTQSDIRVKIYRHLKLLRASVLNFESLDILQDLIGHTSKKLLWFEFPTSFCFQLRASRYIIGLNRTSV